MPSPQYRPDAKWCSGQWFFEQRHPPRLPICSSFSSSKYYIPYHPCMGYLPTFGWNLWQMQMWVNMPYMDSMGMKTFKQNNLSFIGNILQRELAHKALGASQNICPQGSTATASPWFKSLGCSLSVFIRPWILEMFSIKLTWKEGFKPLTNRPN